MVRTKYERAVRRQQGFSLIELMVALTLGLIILFAVSELFVNNNRVRNELELGARQIENGRYAVQMLADDISNAGFFGESGGQAFPAVADIPPTCFVTAPEAEESLGMPIFGEAELTSGIPACLDGFKSGNSYLALRRASTCSYDVATCPDGSVDGELYLQVAACQSQSPGTIALGSGIASLSFMDRTCQAGVEAPKYRYLSRIYYVNDDNQLVRAELTTKDTDEYVATPLVDGVEAAHFEYGIDSDRDGVPENFKSAPTLAEWEDVVAVRIWMLTRNTQATTGFVDKNTYTLGDRVIDAADLPAGFKRQVYSSTVRLNNIAGRRDAS